MKPSGPPETPAPARAGALPPGAAAAVLVALLAGCAPADKIARKDVETLHSDVQQMEVNLQARQAGVYEQIRDLREEQSRLERVSEENARAAKTLGQQVERLRERTGEELASRDKTQRESAQAAADQLARLGARVDALQKDFQKSLQTLNDNLIAMSAFEKKQEERIAKVQEQFESQLKVVVEEVGQENKALNAAIAAARGDLDGLRQETAAGRQGLADAQAATQKLAERISAAQAQVQELARKQESARKAAARSGAQHTVRTGETLSMIAARYGVGVQALMEKNRITDPDSILEGQKLAIPEP